MTAIFKNESRGMQRGSLILAGVFAVTTVFFLAVFPAMKDQAALIQEAYPEYMLQLMGIEEIHTIEGFTAGYIFPFIWLLFGGVYFGYLGAGLIAGDINSRKMDLTLSTPVSRESVVVQKFAALVVPLVVLNATMIVVLYGGANLIGESLGVVRLVLVHFFGIPYLLTCAGIGVTLSVVIDRVGTAQVTALGLVFMLWLVDGISEMDDSYEWIGYVTPSRYLHPSDILIRGEYAVFDLSVLLLAVIALVGVATVIFTRRDL